MTILITGVTVRRRGTGIRRLPFGLPEKNHMKLHNWFDEMKLEFAW